MVEEKYRIPLFDGNNFNNWKFRVETLLNELDLLKFIEKPYTRMVEFAETDTAEKRAEKQNKLQELQKYDRKCKSQLIQRIADSHLEYAKDKETAYDLWTSLSGTFERTGIASQLLIRKTLLMMKFNAKIDSLSNHFLNFDKLIRDLRSTGAKIEEIDVVCHLLLTMPAEYDIVVTAIETLLKNKLHKQFHMKDLGEPQSYLGISITRSNGELHLSQSTYLQKLLKRFNMQDCKPINTPMEPKLSLETDSDEMVSSKPIRELIGCLMYAMLATRPDLSFAVNYLSRYQTKPTETLWKCLKSSAKY